MANSPTIYVSLPGIRGGVREKGYEGWLEALHYRFEGLRRGMGTSRGGSVEDFGPQRLTLVFPQGEASGGVMVWVATGRHLHKIRLDVLRSGKKGPELLASYELKNCIAENVSTRQGVDTASFAYVELRMKHTGKGPVLDTKIPPQWNLKK